MPGFGMRKVWHRFLKREDGEAVFTLPVVLLTSMIFLVIAVNILQFGMVTYNLYSITGESLQQVKMQNGSDAKIRQDFYEMVRLYKMNPDLVTYEATPKLLQRDDMVSVSASMTYHVWALDLIKVDLDVPIKITLYGRAFKNIREGG